MVQLFLEKARRVAVMMLTVKMEKNVLKAVVFCRKGLKIVIGNEMNM